MKKKLILFLMTITICLASLTLSGCSEGVNLPEDNISLSMSLNNDGTITQQSEFSMQTKLMKKLLIKDSLINEVQTNMLESVLALRNEFYLSFLVTYSNNPNTNFKIGDAVQLSQVLYDKDYDVVYFSIHYRDILTWQYYHNSEASDNNDNKPIGHGSKIKFFTKTSSEGAFPFSAKFTQADGKEITIGERYLNIYKNAFNITLPNEICAKLATPKFVYDYATPFANLRSNADICLQSGGLYHNIWIRDYQSHKDAWIKLTVTTVYAGWWYLSLLVTVIFIFSISLVIYKIKNKKSLI